MSNVKYAKNLLGDWERAYLDANRDVAKQQFSTNWEDIKNQYNNLVNRIETQKQQARQTYNKGLGTVAEGGFEAMQGATQDLANRGLTSSGILDKAVQANTQQKGEQVNELLGALGEGVANNAENLSSAGQSLASSQRSATSNLSNALGNIGAADLENQMEYANTIASLAESKASRDASNAAANQDDEIYDRIAIAQLIAGVDENGNELDSSAEERARMLGLYYGLNYKNALESIKAYDKNSTKTADKNKEVTKANNKLKWQTVGRPLVNTALMTIPGVSQIVQGVNAANNRDIFYDEEAIKKAQENYENAKNKEITYEDIYKILYK